VSIGAPDRGSAAPTPEGRADRSADDHDRSSLRVVVYGRAFQLIVLPSAAVGVLAGLALARSHGFVIGCCVGLALFVLLEWLSFCLFWLAVVLRDRATAFVPVASAGRIRGAHRRIWPVQRSSPARRVRP